ncbi:hypothetical protein BsWGS_23341 [Bradybaena similaris]
MQHQLNCTQHPDAILVDDDDEEELTCLECGFVINKDVIYFIDELPNAKGTKDNSGVGAAELSSSDSAFITAFREIAEMSLRLNQPKTLIDKATTLFKRIHESNVVNGHSNDAIISICMYVVCQQVQIPISFKEIYSVSKASQQEISCAFRKILKDWDRSFSMLITGFFMDLHCYKLGVSSIIRDAAIHISSKAVEKYWAPGQDAIPIKAAALYMACQASDNKKTIKEVEEATCVPEVDIIRSYKRMLPDAVELFPLDFKFCTSVENLPTHFDEVNIVSNQENSSDLIVTSPVRCLSHL